MIESPLIQELMDEVRAERMHKAILGILEDRFGPLPEEVVHSLTKITDDDQLQDLNKLAARCQDLASFRGEMQRRQPS